MLIFFYISGHGFGHASRDIELANAIAARDPTVRIVARTAVAPWLFSRCRANLVVQPLDTDTGLVQIDSLRFDERQTISQAAAFYRDFGIRAANEAAVLRNARADLVIGDIPPLAFAAAALAGVPAIALGNFTWDWIYEAYAFESAAPEVIPTIRRAYSQATAAFRLPFHGGFEPMARVLQDVPLIARRSQRNPVETRRLLGVPRDKPFVLASFGAYGAAIPHDIATRDAAFTLMEVDQHPPHGLLYEDLVAAADVVVSKPGYGIVSECIANDTALLYTSRGRFREYDRFVEEMPRMLRCRYLSQEQLLGGEWTDSVLALIAQPEPLERPRTDGAAVVADAIAR